jgi:hypothetical protein
LECIVNRAAIIGNKLPSTQYIEVKIKEDCAKSEIPKHHLKAYMIVPDQPYLNEHAAKEFARFILDEKTKEKLKEFEKACHTPNMLPARELFNAITQEILLCKGKNASVSETSALADKLRRKAIIKSDWPLKIEMATREWVKEQPLEADTEIDCPVYILYHSYAAGYWTLKKVENLKEAQHIITKSGYKRKGVDSIIVLHNLKPISFSLFEDTDEGLVPINKENAYRKKNLRLSWRK